MDDCPTLRRALSADERALLGWLLTQGGGDARVLLPQVDDARVVDGCACGCASLGLAVDGRPADNDAPMQQVTPDFFWTEPNGGLCCVWVFARGGTLAGLEVCSIDGEATPAVFPSINQLRLAEDLPH